MTTSDAGSQTHPERQAKRDFSGSVFLVQLQRLLHPPRALHAVDADRDRSLLEQQQ